MNKINPSDLLNMDWKKKMKEDPRFKEYYDQLNEEQQAHVENFVEELHGVFMPSVTKFYEGLNEMSDEERKTFKENIQKLNS
ncbi:hypothetical protein OAA09_01305 [bacterium]|nr:hypothetical protein [bacterium]